MLILMYGAGLLDGGEGAEESVIIARHNRRRRRVAVMLWRRFRR